MQAATISCPSCNSAIAVGRFLSACSDFSSDTDSVCFKCPECHQSADARVEQSRISLGYIYSTGAPHFRGMVDVPVDGLLVWREGDDLVAELNAVTHTIHARSKAAARST